MSTHHEPHGNYYVPEYSWWPILAAIGLFLLGLGSVEYFGADNSGLRLLLIGIGVLLLVLIGWFGTVIKESRRGLYDVQMHRTFRWGMLWFIFSDAMLFVGLLGTLWYYRIFNLPELSGDATRMLTHFLLWPDFVYSWPVLVNPDPGQFTGPQQGLALNWQSVVGTLVLLGSGMTLFFANVGLYRGHRALLNSGLITTFLLACLFFTLNMDILHLAITRFGLTMSSGIYGSVVLFMLAIFLLHVFIASIMLLLIALRSFYGHFSPQDDFSVRAFTWFWYFLIIVWTITFFSIY